MFYSRKWPGINFLARKNGSFPGVLPPGIRPEKFMFMFFFFFFAPLSFTTKIKGSLLFGYFGGYFQVFFFFFFRTGGGFFGTFRGNSGSAHLRSL